MLIKEKKLNSCPEFATQDLFIIAVTAIFIKKSMGQGGYKIRDKEGIHFITFAVTEWVDVFTRREYRDIVLDSIKHCQKEKGLVLHAWCLMSNHVHLVVSAKNNDTSDILRDFKKFTSKQIIKAIEENPGESRKEWMLKIFYPRSVSSPTCSKMNYLTNKSESKRL